MTTPITFQSKTIFPWLTHALHRLHLTSFLVALTLSMMPVPGTSQSESKEAPVGSGPDDLIKIVSNFSRIGRINSTDNMGSLLASSSDDASLGSAGDASEDSQVHRTATVAENNGVPREFPSALVIASSIAAVSILIFFFVSYYWHTHQLDSRARKLAIRMAADSEHGIRCSNCSSHSRPSAPTPSRSLNRGYMRAASDSSQEPNTCEVLTIDEERAEGAGSSMGGRSSIVVSESDTGDPEDVFEPADITQVARGIRGSVRGGAGRGAYRKWSRSSRKFSGPPMEGKRYSAVTDKEILTHFASRRHSTFFI